MTQYRYECVFNDSETIALDAAIKMYSEYCKEQIEKGKLNLTQILNSEI